MTRDAVQSEPKADQLSSRMGRPSAPSQMHVWVRYLLVALCSVLYLLPFLRVLSWQGDEGTLLTGAVRVLEGQVPYRDFFEVMGPGTFYWLAAFLKIFGTTWAATRICMLVTATATTLLMFHLSRRLGAAKTVLPLILFIPASYEFWTMNTHHTASTLFGLLSFTAFLRWMDTRNAAMLFLAGAGAGITTLFLQPKGVLLCLAFFVLVFLNCREKRMRAVLWLSGGYAVVLTSIVVLYALSGGLHDLLYANVVWPLTNYSDINNVPYGQGFHDYWKMFSGSFALVGPPVAAKLIAAGFSLPFVAIAGLPVALAALGFFGRRQFFGGLFLPYWLVGAALWLAEVHRKDLPHLVFGSPVLVILAVHLCQRMSGRWVAPLLGLVTTCAAMLGMSNTLVGLLSSHAQYSRRGVVYSSLAEPDPTLSFTNQHVRAGEQLFVYPYSPQYYFFTATQNPTRYSILMYYMNTEGQFQDAVKSLERGRVRYVIWDQSFARFAPHFFPKYHVPPPDQLIMEPYLQSHYRRVSGKDGGVGVFERNNDAEAGASSAAEFHPSNPIKP